MNRLMPTNYAKNKQINQLLVNFMGILTKPKIYDYIEKRAKSLRRLKLFTPFRLASLNFACKND